MPWYDSRRLQEGLWEIEESGELDENGMPVRDLPTARPEPRWRPDEADERLEPTGSEDVWRPRPRTGEGPARPQGRPEPAEGSLDEFAGMGITTRRRSGAR